MSKQIGVIAEDQSDVEVIRAFITSRTRRSSFQIRKFVGKGCGRIKNKCRAWASDLQSNGCTYLLLVHDLDERQLPTLELELDAALHPCPIERHVVAIPVREMEAWLLSDSTAIRQALNLKDLPKDISRPETILDAKAKLAEIVYMKSGKRKDYVNTLHNPLIAKNLRQSEVIRKCPSFRKLDAFISAHFAD